MAYSKAGHERAQNNIPGYVKLGTGEINSDINGRLEIGFVPSFKVGLSTTATVQFQSLGIGTPAPGTTGEIRSTGNITAYYTSDKRLKENIRNIDSALEKVKSLNGVLFDWKQSYIDERGGEDGFFVRKADTGIIAQEVEQVLPETVGTRQDGYKAVQYEKLAGLLIESIKELDNKVEEIKKHLGI